MSTIRGKQYTKRLKSLKKRNYNESLYQKLLPENTESSESSEEYDGNAKNVKPEKNHKKINIYNKKSKKAAENVGDDSVEIFGCTIFGKNSHFISDMIDIAIRIAIVFAVFELDKQIPFQRIIHLEEMWKYKNARSKEYISSLALTIAIVVGEMMLFIIQLLITKNKRDFRAVVWAWTLCLCLNGVMTSLLKLCVGRPRPDYFYRCFPDGIMQLAHNGTGTDNMLDLFNCTGNIDNINEGRRSFPSGHASHAFAGFGFLTLYFGAKLHAFNRRGRGETWRLIVALLPLIFAVLVAISRTCDYYHHWEDVTVGAVLGLFVAYLTYRQYYPSIFSRNCHRPYARSKQMVKINGTSSYSEK